jgi:hypothetical protein
MRVTSGGAGPEPALNGTHASPREPLRGHHFGERAEALVLVSGASCLAISDGVASPRATASRGPNQLVVAMLWGEGPRGP